MPYLDDSAGATVVEVVRRRAIVAPQTIACSFLDGTGEIQESLTCAELDARARSAAAVLSGRVEPGERVLLLYPPGLEFVWALLGCFYAGIVAVPVELPRARRPEKLAAIAADCTATAILTCAGGSGKLASALGGVDVLRTMDWLETRGLEDRPPDTGRRSPSTDDLAMLQYTSGSTGSPKGVTLTYGNISANADVIRRRMEHNATCHCLSWLPHHHDMGLIGNILEPLSVGYRTTLMSPLDFFRRPLVWLRAITRQRATVCGAPNTAYEMCTRQVEDQDIEALDLSSWDTVYCGAEPIRRDTVEQFCARFARCGLRREAFFPCYGLAESTLMVTGGPRGAGPRYAPDVDAHEGESPRRRASAGVIDESYRLAIVDPRTGIRCGEREVGEVWVSGPSVARGYWGREAETERTFRARLTAQDDTEYLRTGDLGFVDDGHLYITGRVKDLIIIAGINHHPEDIECSVKQVLGRQVLGAAAFSIDVASGEACVVVVELTRQDWRRLASEAETDDLTPTIRSTVAQAHGIDPADVLLLPPGSLPYTSSGKIQRSLAREHYLSGELQARARKRSRRQRRPAQV